jgi:indole-3-glycerol phosphate synthase
VDLATTEKLAERLCGGTGIAPGYLEQETHGQDLATMLVAESGIHTKADVERLAKCGAKAILVGESLMKEGNIQAKVRELIG